MPRYLASLFSSIVFLYIKEKREQSRFLFLLKKTSKVLQLMENLLSFIHTAMSLTLIWKPIWSVEWFNINAVSLAEVLNLLEDHVASLTKRIESKVPITELFGTPK